LNETAERESFRSVGNGFHARGAATENILSPILRLVLSSSSSSFINRTLQYSNVTEPM